MYTDEQYMRLALAQAELAAKAGEVPVGAVLVNSKGEVLGQGYNQPISLCDPTAHAEMVVLRQAALALANYRLPDTTLYVTLEPCAMCVGALHHARIKRLVYGAAEPRTGACGSVFTLLNACASWGNIEVTKNVLQDAAVHQLRAFFQARR